MVRLGHYGVMRRRGTRWAVAILYATLLVGVTLFLGDHGAKGIDLTNDALGVYTALLGLPPAFLAVVQLWRRQRSTLSLEKVARQLAVAVGNQWDAEAALRRVNDPYPLPVAWRPADEDLTEPWDLLEELARAWPGGPPGEPAGWPQCATGLADEDARIGEVFHERVPTRRMVVLGEPGAGKSVLLMRLLQDLLARRTDDDPVPVLFSLASWHPDQPLKTWLADQLRRSHPSLRTKATATITADTSGDLAQALLETGRILPLLDGFDELPPTLHHRALDALNRSLPAHQPLALAARVAPYRNALSGAGTTVRLNGAAAIQLLPLNSDRAAAYLRRDAGGPHTPAAARWTTVVADLGTASPVGQALSTPLGLFLARTIYNPRPGSAPAATAPHPDELCNTRVFPDRAALDQHLFNAFIPAAYAPDAPHPPRWTPEQAHRTFVTLAHFLEHQRHGSPDLAWWELAQAAPAYFRYLMGGLTSGLTLGTASWIAGGVTGGLAGGLGGGLMGGLALGTAGGLAGALGITDGIANRLTGGLMGGLMGGLVFGAAGETMLGLTGALALGIAGGLTGGLAGSFGITAGITSRLTSGLAGGLIGGLMFGAAGGLAGSFEITDGIASRLTGGHTGWLTGGLTGWLTGGLTGWLTGGLAGATMGGPRWRSATPSAGLRWSFGRLVGGLMGGVLLGIVGVFVGGAAFGDPGIAPGLYVGATTGVLAIALAPKKPDSTSNIGPTSLLNSDRSTFIASGLVGGLVGVLGTSLVEVLQRADATPSVGVTVSGAVLGLLAGLLAGLLKSAWPHFVMTRVYLALYRKAPRALVSFLQDAHEHRGVLRQVGPIYQFRHIDLQRHLAQQHPSSDRRSSQRTPTTGLLRSFSRREEPEPLPPGAS
jgi:hypothetical protein